ncbi:MAG TPA: hybrid sensor histidine kinase/response regulator [Bryobacteraceae bacterium]
MSKQVPGDFSDLSMLELFRSEVETQSILLTEGLLALEKDKDAAQRLKELMRAAHSLKGAARIVGRKAAVQVAHAMEDCFVAVQEKKCILPAAAIDSLLAGIDLLNRNAQIPDEALEGWEAAQRGEIEAFVRSLSSLAEALGQPERGRVESSQAAPVVADSQADTVRAPDAGKNLASASDRVLRVTAGNLDHLMGLAGEALLAARWLDSFSAGMLRLKRLHRQLGQCLEELRDVLPAGLSEQANQRWGGLEDRVASCQRSLAERLQDLELFNRRFASFSGRLYHEVLDCRMRPFADGVQGLQRMVRDVARSLGKTVRFEIKGEATPVDRDILDKLTAPLDHLLRNALDHGIESPVERREKGKPEEGTLELHACHSAGMLLITVSDDGRGIDPNAVRNSVIRRGLNTPEIARKMSQAELLEFLFLPGFTLKESVSEISGRGVGLDVVQTMVKEVGGRVRTSSRRNHGTRFQFELPITRSVVRTLLVEIGGEPYAFPLARVERALKLPKERIESLQGRQHFVLGDEQIGLVTAHQVLELEGSPSSASEASIVVLGDKGARYGLLIDRFLGERELVVRSLDPRLGKVRNFSSAALMPDGSPVLILDVDDVKQSIENLASRQRLSGMFSATGREAKEQKRVLVVDDSLTVRELERKLLDSRGFAVDVAVDGMDGWNAARTGHYHLVITDVDMPRMDGIELLKLIRKDSRLQTLPVMIVSYKDRQEDRSRGLEAGADYYLTKASFHDETLLRVVNDLIGDARS